MNGQSRHSSSDGNSVKDDGECSVADESLLSCSPKSISEIGDRNSIDDNERLDAVWATVEREFEAKRASSLPLSPLIDDALGRDGTGTMRDDANRELAEEEHVSPLMAHPSDATLQTSNKTTSSLLANNIVDDERVAELNNNSTMISSQMNQKTGTKLIPNKPNNIVQRYRRFLQKHEPSLDLLESVMTRFVFYGLFFKHDSRGISIELYYAGWNLFRWMNDVVLVGWGEGMGLTVGRREEWLQPLGTNEDERRKAGAYSFESIMKSAVPMLRAVLTATSCIYPAIEAWSRLGPRSSPSMRGTPLLSYDDNDTQQQSNQEEYQLFPTTTDLSPQKRRQDWEARQCRASTASYRLESVKFVARLALLSISRWAQHRRSRRSLEADGRGGKKDDRTPLPSLLRMGGELDPHEQLIPLKNAEDEAKVVQYVGRRTGRRSISRTLSAKSTTPPSQSKESSFVSKGQAVVKWLSTIASSKNRIVYVYAVGELLHILRPLYWSHAEKISWQKRSSSKKLARSNSSYSFSIWKAWWISLLMDLISDKLLKVDGGDSSSSSNAALSSQRRGSFLSMGGGRSASQQHATSPSAEQAKLEELEYRRSRLPMYLLRSPMYNSVTRPMAIFIGKIVSKFPSFGLGQWAVEYMLDMMSYWNNNHFMLES